MIPEDTSVNDLYMAFVRGLACLSVYLNYVKINRESFESLVFVANVAEHFANRRLVAGEVSRLIAEAKGNLRAGDDEAAKTDLYRATKIIDVLENERIGMWNPIVCACDYDRYIDYELPGGDGDENNLY